MEINRYDVCDGSCYKNIWLVIWLGNERLISEDADLGCSSQSANETLNIMAIINCANLFLLNKTNTY